MGNLWICNSCLKKQKDWWWDFAWEGDKIRIIKINLESQGKDKQYTIPQVKEMEKDLVTKLLQAPTGEGKRYAENTGSSELARRIGVPQ